MEEFNIPRCIVHSSFYRFQENHYGEVIFPPGVSGFWVETPISADNLRDIVFSYSYWNINELDPLMYETYYGQYELWNHIQKQYGGTLKMLKIVRIVCTLFPYDPVEMCRENYIMECKDFTDEFIENAPRTAIQLYMKAAARRMRILLEELMAATWHPERFMDWCLEWDHELKQN